MVNSKYIKFFDMTSVEVQTYVKSLRKNDSRSNAHKTVHQSKLGGYMTIFFVSIMSVYFIHLL